MSARKNLLVIVEALAKLTESEQYPLVIIGRKTEYTNVVQEYAKKAGIHHLLVFPTDVSNVDLPGVYQGASLFLYLSLYEGFGIPVLEGLCSRVPVVTSNISSLPEAGGAAARIIDPTKSDLVSDAMREISNSNELKQEMIARGIEHSNQFTSDLFANKTMELYQYTLAQSGSR
jgi:glycosyltransferase involved in cell wall biosynthesis